MWQQRSSYLGEDPGLSTESFPSVGFYHELNAVCPFRSMLPDVVDDFKVQNPDVHGHEALFYSFYVFFIKFASGLSLGISTLSLK